jgi:hypothetical protein
VDSYLFLIGLYILTDCNASFPASDVEPLVPMGAGRSGGVSLGSVVITIWLDEAGLSSEV